MSVSPCSTDLFPFLLYTPPPPPPSAPLKRREGEGICLTIFLCFACAPFCFRIANDLNRALACSVASQCLGVSIKSFPFFYFPLFSLLSLLVVLAGRRRHALSITPLIITLGRGDVGCAAPPLQILVLAPSLSSLQWLFSLCDSADGTVAF